VGDIEMLAIPADAAREGSPTRATGIADVEVTLDGPVVRYVEEAPLAIVEIGLSHDYGITEVKAPVLIEALSVSGLRCCQSAEYTDK
jgi:hypothetical protein